MNAFMTARSILCVLNGIHCIVKLMGLLFSYLSLHLGSAASMLLNTTPGIMPTQRRDHAAALPVSPVMSPLELITPLSGKAAMVRL